MDEQVMGWQLSPPPLQPTRLQPWFALLHQLWSKEPFVSWLFLAQKYLVTIPGVGGCEVLGEAEGATEGTFQMHCWCERS